ncbi:MAG: hypothetical protein DI564_15690 [Rhodanobacter denitrificans]|uniref:Uncharacterized protein n=1 Tax=Rhodanobacter denitrificans TaxID=666685 RepID=A0A2W5K5T7_9GAMM|nr:MAG: hypothetical protein DI564_15690 [Rhodanobacter denitrificans]
MAHSVFLDGTGHFDFEEALLFGVHQSSPNLFDSNTRFLRPLRRLRVRGRKFRLKQREHRIKPQNQVEEILNPWPALVRLEERD